MASSASHVQREGAGVLVSAQRHGDPIRSVFYSCANSTGSMSKLLPGAEPKGFMAFSSNLILFILTHQCSGPPKYSGSKELGFLF